MLLSFDSKEDLLISLNEKDSDEDYLIISNYKSIKKWSLIPLKNITVLLGPNSAGKSTIDDCLHLLSLLIYPNYYEEKTHEFLMKIFEGYRSKFNYRDRPQFGFSTSFKTRYLYINKFYDNRFKDLETQTNENSKYKIYSKLPFISNLIENKKYQSDLMGKRYTLIINEIHPEELNADVYIDKEISASWQTFSNTINFDINKKFIYLCERNISKTEKDILEIFNDSISVRYSMDSHRSSNVWLSFGSTPEIFWKNGKINFDITSEDDLLSSGDFSELNYDIWRVQYGLCLACFHIPINTFLGKIQNINKTEDVRRLNSDWNFFKLGPNKYFAPTYSEKKAADYLKNETSDDGTYGFIHEYFEHIISNKDVSIEKINLINKWLFSDTFLDTRYKLSIDTKLCIPEKFLFPKPDIKKALTIKSENALNEYGYSEVEFLYRLRLIDENERHLDFKNVGAGISQLIPILSSIISSSSFIKQPEVHLHPKLQSRLADCIIDAFNIGLSEKLNKFFIIETHSEHLILRFLRRVRNSFLDSDLHTSLTLSSRNISFVYFKPLKDETAIYQIRIDENGNFLDKWPDGFFDDRDEDIWS